MNVDHVGIENEMNDRFIMRKYNKLNYRHRAQMSTKTNKNITE